MERWDLRRVMEEGKTTIAEVYYRKDGLPWGYCPADFKDKIKYLGDWLLRKRLVFPRDFVKQEAYVKEIKNIKKELQKE